jgi:hypothetical protein
MTVKIGRMRLRIPAGAVRRPEAFAAEVAERIAQGAAGIGPVSAESLRLGVKAARSRDGALAGRSGDAVVGALGRRGEG